MFAILNSRGESIYLLNGGDVISYRSHPNFPNHSTLIIGEILFGFYTNGKCLELIKLILEAIEKGEKVFKMPPDDE